MDIIDRIKDKIWWIKDDWKRFIKKLFCKHEYELYYKVIGEKHGRPYDVISEGWRCKHCDKIIVHDFEEAIRYRNEMNNEE
jgi:hypothetical protein